VDKLIVSIGRVPNTIGLNAEAVGLKLDERGAIVVDADCKTNLGVWAVGDVVRGPMLAHKAEEEGVAVAERIAGQHGHVNFNTIPGSSTPAPRSPGSARPSSSSRPKAWPTRRPVPFLANGRARALGDTTGFVKFLADAKTDEILGVHIVPDGLELISEAVVAMEFKASAEDIARICHAHPPERSDQGSRPGGGQAHAELTGLPWGVAPAVHRPARLPGRRAFSCPLRWFER
jgi:dihydrolipoamide dehydrogenase